MYVMLPPVIGSSPVYLGKFVTPSSNMYDISKTKEKVQAATYSVVQMIDLFVLFFLIFVTLSVVEHLVIHQSN